MTQQQEQQEQRGQLQEQPRVYLDYAATAPLDMRLHAVMMNTSWANANSLHAEGREARKQLEDARRRIARALGARQPDELIFTSGGTESDNMALKGLLPVNGKPEKLHVVVSGIEHHAVLDAAAALKREGYHVDVLDPGNDGIVGPDALESLCAQIEDVGDKVALVSVMAVNNELGTIQPVRELVAVAHAHGAKFHTDAVQALGKLGMQLEKSGVDAASFSGHKIGSPKGVGALYLRRSAKLSPIIHGGGQERGLRSGTSNVMGAACFAASVEFSQQAREANWDHARTLRSRLLDALPNLQATHELRPVLASQENAVPHTLCLVASGLEGETLVQRLNALGFAVSSGSACSTGSLDPSHVLLAVGVSKQEAYGELRLSFGPATTVADIDRLIDALPQALR